MKIAIAAFFALSTVLHAASPEHVRVVASDEFADTLAPAQRAAINAEAAHNIAELTRAGLLPPAHPASTTDMADLAWPLRPVAGFDQFDYYGISYFVDHDTRAGFVQDYTCGARTYDLPTGYNHAGTDYYLWPFPWRMMDQGFVQVVAAAPGVIVAKADGSFDRSCAIQSHPVNFVNVLQDDGLHAIYLHLRNGSVTALPIGARVAAGDYLGTVGSSGASSGPHLHFELDDAAGNVVDPRHGQCNAAPDRWIVFQPYEDPHIDSISTHSAEPVFIPCGVDDSGNPIDETPNYKDTFAPGDVLWVFASYRDIRSGMNTDFSILRPDGSVFAHWGFDLASQTLPSDFYSGTALDWKYTLPADAAAGTWNIVAQFAGQTYTRTFTVVGTPQIALGGYLSGNWFDPSPNQSGHGFQLEFTNQANTALAIWFVYAPNGGAQNWIYAQGSYDTSKNAVTLPAVLLSGARFPPNFRSNDVTTTAWGTLTFAFTDCYHGVASWVSTLPGYGSGAIPIQRLTQIAGTSCPP
jgi:hypothetical protein